VTPAARKLDFTEVYREHFDFVYRKAARMLGPGHDAEDAAQEVFLVVSRKLHTYDGTSAVTTWLFGILFNVARRMRRKAWLRAVFERGGPSEDEPLVAPDRAEVAEARRIAYEILDQMSAKHRDVFILYELEGLRGEEIAGLVGCPVETVWSRLHYARKEFAGRLRARGIGASP
jgi:RNA polymerase sigma-70 factor, ECF subfamily